MSRIYYLIPSVSLYVPTLYDMDIVPILNIWRLDIQNEFVEHGGRKYENVNIAL